MPIYEYECDQCGQIEEAIQKFSDRPLIKCSHCNGKLHQLISQSSFHLKGSGWYADGYADKSCKNSKTPQDDKKPAASAENAVKSDSVNKSNSD